MFSFFLHKIPPSQPENLDVRDTMNKTTFRPFWGGCGGQTPGLRNLRRPFPFNGNKMQSDPIFKPFVRDTMNKRLLAL